MHKPTDTGMNRTGIKMSPIDSKQTIQAAQEMAQGVDGHALEEERVRWSRESEPVGTVPPPGSMKGVVKTIFEKLKGNQPTVLIDKLGERLAYERTGTRIYEAILAKFDAGSVHEGGPTRVELEEIHAAEHRHFTIVRDALLQLGADPTAMTPSADIIGVSSLGWIQVVTDPRTTLTQALDVTLAIELGDADGWQLLVELTEALGFDELAARFREAHVEEAEHVIRVRRWLTNAVIGQAGAEPTQPQPAA